MRRFFRCFSLYVRYGARQQTCVLETPVNAAHSAHAQNAAPHLTCGAPFAGSAATGCGRGGRAAALDAESISDAAAASDWRDMIGLLNAHKSARVSSLLYLLRAGDSMAEIVRRRPNLWLRKYALSSAFHPLNGQNDINNQNMFIGVV